MKPFPRFASLQARLLALLLGWTTLIWLGAAALTWIDSRHELDELLDSHLAQAAALLVVQQVPDDEDGVVEAPSLHKYAPKVAFQVFHEGRLLTRSANAQTTPLSTQAHGFSTVIFSDNTTWRVFGTHGPEKDVQVFVGEQTTSRNAILWAVLRSVLLPMFMALPLLALAGWWAVRQGLTPLRQLSLTLRQRQAKTRTPLHLGDVPAEIEPVVLALNELFERIELMRASERQFTADAAHELRTPIAGIRAQVQVAMGAGDDSAQSQHALQATLEGCDRATRLVEQLLTLARLEAPTGSDNPVLRVDLSAVARRVAADLAPAALARHQTLELVAASACHITGNELLAAVLVRNLLDNALRYSPEGAQIQVHLDCVQGQTVLQVQDSGPGMKDADMARLGTRFFRVLGHDMPGSGLGWSIIKRITKVMGAQVRVGRSQHLGGLAVSVTWPNPPKA